MNSVCSRNSPQPFLDPPKSEWQDGQRQINKAGKCIRVNTAFWTILRDGVSVQNLCAVCIEFAFGRLVVMTTQASWLAQVELGVLIGQRTCWLMTEARESIDSPHAKSDRLHVCRDIRQLVTTVPCFFRENGACLNFLRAQDVGCENGQE